MSNETAISIYEPKDRDDATWVAETIINSKLAPAGMDSAPKILVAMMHGAALGLSAMQAIQNIHVIKGKPTLSADLMGAVVRSSSACLYLREAEATITRVTMVCARADDPDHEFSRTWTMDDAKRAKLAESQTWKSYPRQMLRARCLSEICRAVFPEVVGGFYVPTEMNDEVHAEPQTVSTPEAAASRALPKASDAVIDVTPEPAEEAPAKSSLVSDLLDRVGVLQNAGVKFADKAAADLIKSAGQADDDVRALHGRIIGWIESSEADAATGDE